MTQQLTLFDAPRPSEVINVAKVTHRSPLRYPGGKTWLVPRIYQWLLSRDTLPSEFIEPFCGGAIVGLTVAFEGLASHVTLVEIDEQIAAIWQTIISDVGGGAWLADQIEAFEVTSDSVEELLSRPASSTRQRAFQALVQNRTSRGGIMAKGAGRIKHGEAGKGIASRWYPVTLARRIREIAAIRDRLTFVQQDGLEVMQECGGRSDAVWFIDPPYTAGGKRAGRRLYNHSELDHARLFELADNLAGDFLITYDNASAVQTLASEQSFDTQPVAMKNTHHAKMTELLIGRELGWVRAGVG